MARLTCPKKHKLVPEIKADVSITLITCDVCFQSEELVFHSCRACNYDVCEYCLWKHFVEAGLATKHTYSPARSIVKQGALLKFLSQDILDVSKCPGIGPVFLTTLRNHGVMCSNYLVSLIVLFYSILLTVYCYEIGAGIETLYQLMGFFARYRGVGVTQEQWTQAFYTWLIFQGANATWAHTVTTVLADKLSLLFDPVDCPVFILESFGHCDPNELLPLPRRKRVNSPARSAAFDLLKSKMTNAKISDFIEKGDALALGPLKEVFSLYTTRDEINIYNIK